MIYEDLLAAILYVKCQFLRLNEMTVIRDILSEESPVLDDFLYEAIFVPEGVSAPPRSIIENDDLPAIVLSSPILPLTRAY